MIEIIIGLVFAFGAALFFEMQNGEAWTRKEYNKRYESEKQGVPYKDVPYKFNLARITGLSFAGGLIGFLFASFTIISAGHQGVQVTLGEVSMQTLGEGFHFINPISSVHTVDVRVTKADLKNANASTRDMQSVHTDIVVNYRLDGAKVAHVYKEFGLQLEDKILLPAVNETFKAVTARYDSEELITKRSEVSNAIHETIQEKVSKYGLIINETSLVNFGFSAQYEAAIEQKVIATQQKLKAEQDLERIKVESDQRIAKAKGEAESIRIQAQAIQQQGGKEYVELKRIEKWNGELPKTVMGNAVPMFNLKD
jgi:regulator of protease activity HflC (stomatin/prohibitin superfamily)